eukprot:4144648-Lingulodinium_polyedra.AAC.1
MAPVSPKPGRRSGGVGSDVLAMAIATRGQWPKAGRKAGLNQQGTRAGEHIAVDAFYQAVSFRNSRLTELGVDSELFASLRR